MNQAFAGFVTRYWIGMRSLKSSFAGGNYKEISGGGLDER